MINKTTGNKNVSSPLLQIYDETFGPTETNAFIQSVRMPPATAIGETSWINYYLSTPLKNETLLELFLHQEFSFQRHRVAGFLSDDKNNLRDKARKIFGYYRKKISNWVPYTAGHQCAKAGKNCVAKWEVDHIVPLQFIYLYEMNDKEDNKNQKLDDFWHPNSFNNLRIARDDVHREITKMWSVLNNDRSFSEEIKNLIKAIFQKVNSADCSCILKMNAIIKARRFALRAVVERKRKDVENMLAKKYDYLNSTKTLIKKRCSTYQNLLKKTATTASAIILFLQIENP